MNRGVNFMGRLAAAADLQEEPVPGVPIIEIAGDRRVLIEHHKGVTEYTSQCVSITVRYGCVRVAGRCLEICKMTKDQLVVSGFIDSVILDRGQAR